jgi:hypothetical protein
MAFQLIFPFELSQNTRNRGFCSFLSLYLNMQVFGTELSTLLRLMNILVIPPSVAYCEAMVRTKLSLMSPPLSGGKIDQKGVELCNSPYIS